VRNLIQIIGGFEAASSEIFASMISGWVGTRLDGGQEAAMSNDFNIKPVGAPVAALFIKPAPEAAREAVPTQLPAPQSVGAIDAGLRGSAVASVPLPPPGDEVAHQVVIDRAAAEIVYQVVDKRTSEVINQFPDASRLRARAYLRAQDTAKLDGQRLATDRQI
jgi:hypothetical protein